MQPRPPLLPLKSYNLKTQPCHGSTIWPDSDKTYLLLSKTTTKTRSKTNKTSFKWIVGRLISQQKVHQHNILKIIVTFQGDLWLYSNAIHSNKDYPHSAPSMSQNLGQVAKKIKWRCNTGLKTITLTISSCRVKQRLEIISMRIVSVTVLYLHRWPCWPRKIT